MEKNVNKAIETIKALRREFASDAIKDYEILPLVNRKTLEDVGFAVVLWLNARYDYSDKLLGDWKERFLADGYSVFIDHNRLSVKFFVRFDKKEA